MNTFDNNLFWDFSLRLYAGKGVADTCVSLQDKYSVDVNILLFLMWLAAGDRSLSVDEIAAIDRHIRSWRETVVVPLRAVRRSISKSGENTSSVELRNRVKKAELHAERIQQDELFSLFDSHKTQNFHPHLAKQALNSYASYLDSEFPEAEIEDLIAAYEALRTI